MISAIVTLYNPDESVVDHVKGFVTQTDRVILCDNSRDDHFEMFEGIPSVIYTTVHKNLGLSGAFNRVLKDDKYGWKAEDYVIFFDQDSSIKEDHISTLVAEYKKLLKKKIKVGCLIPSIFNLSSNQYYQQAKLQKLGGRTYVTDAVQTSSMLTRYGVLRSIGFWNEDLFLDLCDWDLCWRMQSHSYKVCYTEKVTFSHRIGSKEVSAGVVRAKEGAPIREYYQTRDCLKLIGKKYTPAKYKARFIAQVTVRPILHLVMLPDKGARAHYISKGLHDYFRHINGELST
ncbi:glycosyltransferase [Bilifractor sp. HCP3S3_D3]|uniref:glycosyltransferase n=1 Tax=Bilifractor sp. HCP3S3_D3 TaxID=3438907 RepID=UPI003F8A54A4